MKKLFLIFALVGMIVPFSLGFANTKMNSSLPDFLRFQKEKEVKTDNIVNRAASFRKSHFGRSNEVNYDYIKKKNKDSQKPEVRVAEKKIEGVEKRIFQEEFPRRNGLMRKVYSSTREFSLQLNNQKEQDAEISESLKVRTNNSVMKKMTPDKSSFVEAEKSVLNFSSVPRLRNYLNSRNAIHDPNYTRYNAKQAKTDATLFVPETMNVQEEPSWQETTRIWKKMRKSQKQY